MDVATFRQTFPEFASEAAYPDAQITFWLDIAALRLPADRWSTLLDLGTSFYVAHALALSRSSQKVAAFGGAVGVNTGPMSQKSVDKVSATYDTAAASIEGAGNYNLTTYGTRFYELANLAGMGGVQVGAGNSPWPVGLAQIF